MSLFQIFEWLLTDGNIICSLLNFIYLILMLCMECS